MADGDVQHGGLTPGVSSGIHVVHRWSVADASARSALSLTTVDIGGIARQVDTGDFYILRGVSPAAWQALGSSVVAGDVVGPASAAVGRVATFSNVDGKHIQDSGTLLSSLATTSALTAGDSTALASAQAYTDALATATSSALAAKADASVLTAHTSNTSNPHNATAAQVGAVAKAASSTDNAVMRFDLATGGVAQNSPVTIDDSGNVALPALATVDGRDVSVDGAKLDGIAPGATVAPALSSTTPASVAAAGAVGVGSTTARADHAHAHGSQLGGGLHAAAVDSVSDGFMTAAQSAKLTAVEAGAQVTSFTRVQTALAGATGAIAVNAQKITGLADPTSAQDAATRAYVLANAGGATLSNATPADNGTASAGAATTASRGDHAHGHGTLSGGTFHAQATQSVDGFMSAADKLKQGSLVNRPHQR
jgi:hypothetical protein